MDNLEQGQIYVVTLKTTFVLPFSHYEEEHGEKIACFQEPGVGRFGTQYRKIVVGAPNVHTVEKVE